MDTQTELVRALEKGTQSGKIEWLRQDVDPDLIYCFLGSEKILFTIFNGKGEPKSLFARIHGITCEIRNHDFLWLEGQNEWDLLIRLLRAARIDDKRLSELSVQSLNAVFGDIQKALVE